MSIRLHAPLTPRSHAFVLGCRRLSDRPPLVAPARFRSLLLMPDDDRNLTILPLTSVPPKSRAVDGLSSDRVASSRIRGLATGLDEYLPIMLEVLPTPILVMDEQYRILVANSSARRLLSTEQTSFVGYSVGRYLSMERLHEAREALLSRTGIHRYRDSIQVSGVERDVEVGVEYLQTAGREFLCVTLSDETYHHRERAEWAESHDTIAPPSARIDHAHRLEALGHLTGTLAHDFNNLLGVILASLETAERRLSRGQDPLEDIQRAKMATERSIRTTSEILRYARNRPAELEPISPSTLLEELRGLVERALGDTIVAVFDLRDAAKIRVGPAQLETAILNLIINARDAVDEGGEIRVVLEPRDISEDEAVELGLLSGRHASISVVDSGRGMTDEVKRRVFEPFYTTKPEGRGTGLGLSTVRSVAHKYGGAVRLETSPGRGTRVELIFPAV